MALLRTDVREASAELLPLGPAAPGTWEPPGEGRECPARVMALPGLWSPLARATSH